jgi:aryl-alcohol dehydrogenase-like predicted oxidoreductase
MTTFPALGTHAVSSDRARKALADRRDTTVASVAVAWCLAYPGVTTAIVGARDARHCKS